ncbi:MAG TPA: DNA polymerase, partial [Candidatus Binatia bacterium]|nr:DNA polymerase [Candidatus Binatia bacterium]
MRFAHASERAWGPTFDPARIGWIDFESRGRVDIAAGAYRYATEADAVVLSYAIGMGPVRRIAVPTFPATLDMVDLPTEFLAFHAKVMTGTGIWAAWNASFDRAIWNYAATGFPLLEPHQIIDVMVQAVASGLPPDLSAAAVASHSVTKLQSGRELIRLFCLPDSTGTPQDNPLEWAAFLAYADRDIDAMRSVFLGTRQLPLAEWREYWAMEAINDRGAAIDLAVVEAASRLAAEDKERAKAELRAITGDPQMTVDMVKRLTLWLLDRLPEEGRAIITKRDEEVDEDGVVTKPAKHALTRRQVERLIAYVGATDQSIENAALISRLLQIRLYGGSKTPAKFAKMLASHVDGVLYGQYVFNGAAQTGRASSRGVQVHNLARDVLADEPDAIDSLIDGCDYNWLALKRPDPVSRQLSLLIRPAFVPAGDHVFVWSDWSQIEARVLPWLAGDDPGALARLQVFREVDADPTVPDLYTRTAAVLSHLPIEEVTKPIRQRGKVAELALGFGGGLGALQSMAAGYGLHLDDAEGRQTVEDWRAANPWCVRFWEALEEAVERAMRLPGLEQPVGRLKYCFARDYLGGSLLCELPSGRFLTYRELRWEPVEEEGDDGRKRTSRQLRFSRGHGRVKLWRGMLCENVVQAVAADVLRGTLRRLEDEGFNVMLHTHDEALVETDLSEAA